MYEGIVGMNLGCSGCGVGRWSRGIPSYRVKMSFVTAAILYSSRSARDSASIRAVLPDPTGLFGYIHVLVTMCIYR